MIPTEPFVFDPLPLFVSDRTALYITAPAPKFVGGVK